MLKDKANTRKQADVGLGAAIAWFTQNSYTVSVPLTESQKYDLVVENGDGEGLKRVQVKTCSHISPSGKFEVMVATNGGNRSGQKTHYFNSKNSDYLFVLTENGDRYLIPSEIVPKKSITLGKGYQKYLI